MYLSDSEEIVAFIVAIAIVIGFVASTYMEIKNTIAEEKAKVAEKQENEEKIKTLITYFDTKKKLIDTVVQANKKKAAEINKPNKWKRPYILQKLAEQQIMDGSRQNTPLVLLIITIPNGFNLAPFGY